jgi:hypothetical protein
MNMKKLVALACMALAFITAGTSMADDNTGSGGTITYTDSNGSNAVASPPYIGGYVVHTFTNSGTLNIPVPASANVREVTSTAMHSPSWAAATTRSLLARVVRAAVGTPRGQAETARSSGY